LSFLDAFTRICQQHEQRIALVEGERELSYSELWRRSREVGAAFEPDTLVALQFPKSIDYVVALLGCWWAGAAFTPLDPELPEIRRKKLVQHVDRVLTELPKAGLLQPRPLAPDQLAYVLYTSGSTGEPNGVEICHAGLVPLLKAQIEAFDLSPGKRALWLLSMQFDASLSDLGTALLSGATLVVAPAGAAVDLPRCLSQHRITHLDVPPALLRSYRPEQMPPCLETLIVGGEASDPVWLRHWGERFRVISVYGPTEATICTSLARVDASWSAARLGEPIAGMQHVLLPDHELGIVGPGLARGYRGQPELTAQRFVNWQDQRCYRTGDLVSDDFVFLGRLDRQVQLRGSRLEPEEIERAALALPSVCRCTVLLRSNRLVAFYQGEVSALELRAHLEERLPAWMVPHHLVPLPNFPLTASGKSDLRQLTELAESYGAENPIDSLAALEIAARLQSEGHAVTATEVLEGARRPEHALSTDALRFAGPVGLRRTGGQAILLTGATGALGSLLLARLSALGREVICPLREAERLGPGGVEADLSRPDWGLPSACWNGWAEQVERVYHCAALVHNLLPFSALRSVNVDALRPLVALGKPIHYASTLSVFVSSDFVDRARRSDTLVDHHHDVYGGYAQSKWAAEWLVRQCGLPTSIYRYGLLCGGGRRDWLTLFFQGLARLGCYPVGPEIRLDLTPIEFAAEATLQLSEPGTYHIANRRGASLEELVKAMPVALEPLEPLRFFARPADSPEAAAAQLALSRLHPDPAYRQRNRALDLFLATDVDWEVDLDPPAITPEYLRQLCAASF
jgi:acyl-coenzyme A synthetase/AMP-(fatty) acid ligase/nucleoside-diphosphate-sugar epimerase